MNLLSDLYPFEILVVDDNFVNQKLIQKLFEVLGYRIDLVKNGLEACNATVIKDYHLVFMDIQMPEMDGYEATRIILERLGPNAPVIIALTASAAKGDKDKCKLTGMSDYLAKPVRIQDLSAMISHWGELKKDLFADTVDK